MDLANLLARLAASEIILSGGLKEPPRHGAIALFPNLHGGRLSLNSVQSLLAKHVQAASTTCPSLATKRVTPHLNSPTPIRSAVR